MSDDGKYIYAANTGTYINVSKNYGSTFANITAGRVGPSALSTINTVSTIQTGEILFCATTDNYIQYSTNAGVSFTTKAISTVIATEVNTYTNTIYYAIGSALYYYKAGTRANLLTTNISTASFTSPTITGITGNIYHLKTVGNISVILTDSKKVFISYNGTYFNQITSLTLLGTYGYQAWIVLEPYVGFIMIGSESGGAPPYIYYSLDSGVTWQQYSHSITGIPHISSGTCVLQGTNLDVYLYAGYSTADAPPATNSKLFKFSFPITTYTEGSLSFTNNRALQANSSAYTLGTNTFTLEAWVYCNDPTPVAYQGIMATSSGSPNSNGIGIIIKQSKFYIDINNGQTQAGPFPPVTTPDLLIQSKTWYHIAYIRSSTTLGYFCVNGIRYTVGNNTVTGTNITETALVLGQRFASGADASTTSLNGFIAQVRLSNIVVYTGDFSLPPKRLKSTQSAVTNTNIAALTSGQVTSLIDISSNWIDPYDVVNAGTTFTVPTSTGAITPTIAVVDTTCYPICF